MKIHGIWRLRLESQVSPPEVPFDSPGTNEGFVSYVLHVCDGISDMSYFSVDPGFHQYIDILNEASGLSSVASYNNFAVLFSASHYPNLNLQFFAPVSTVVALYLLYLSSYINLRPTNILMLCPACCSHYPK